MLSLAFTAAMFGIEGYVVRVEADSSPGTPGLAIIGLPDRALTDAKERVRFAIFNSGFRYPSGRLLVNLSPADIRPCTLNGSQEAFEGQPAAIVVRGGPNVPILAKVGTSMGMGYFDLATTYPTLSSDEGPPFGHQGISQSGWVEAAPALRNRLVRWN